MLYSVNLRTSGGVDVCNCICSLIDCNHEVGGVTYTGVQSSIKWPLLSCAGVQAKRQIMSEL